MGGLPFTHLAVDPPSGWEGDPVPEQLHTQTHSPRHKAGGDHAHRGDLTFLPRESVAPPLRQVARHLPQ